MDKQSRCHLAVLLAVALALVWAGGPALAGDASTTGTDSGSGIVQPAPGDSEASEITIPLGFGGLRIVVDPQTGEVISEPSAEMRLDLVMDQELLRRMDTSHEDLVEQAGPRGGVMLNLQGRFMSPLVAVVGPDGSVQMDHAALATESTPTNNDVLKTEEAGHETP